MRIPERMPLRQLSDLRLRQFTQRKQHVRQIVLRQVVQHVALVFRRIQPAPQLVAPRCLVIRPARIMPRRNIVVPQLRTPLLQRRKLQIPVAVDARVRCPSTQIRIAKPVDHLATERAREIEREVLQPQAKGHLPRILNVALAAARALAHHARAAGAGNLVVEQLHRHAAGVKARIAQQQRSHRAINPAAHRNEHALTFLAFHQGFLLHALGNPLSSGPY